MDKHEVVRKLRSLKAKTQELGTFKGRAQITGKIRSSMRFLEQHVVEDHIAEQIYRECCDGYKDGERLAAKAADLKKQQKKLFAEAG